MIAFIPRHENNEEFKLSRRVIIDNSLILYVLIIKMVDSRDTIHILLHDVRKDFRTYCIKHVAYDAFE